MEFRKKRLDELERRITNLELASIGKKWGPFSETVVPLDDISYVNEFTFYSDNVAVQKGITISLSPCDWCKLVNQPCFLSVLEYLEAAKIPGSKEALDAALNLTET